MNSFSVEELKDNTFFTNEVYIDKQFILLNPTVPFTDKLKEALKEWGFNTVYSDGSITANLSTGEIDTSKFRTISFEPVSIDEVEEKEQENNINSNVKKVFKEAHFDLANNEKSRLSVVQTVYNEYMNYITAVYTHYATHKTLNYKEISETVQDLCMFIRENRRYVLRITPVSSAGNKNFLISHSMRSTVISIVIGLQLRMPLTKLVELGVTCILHEIGQILLPPQLYMTERQLTIQERTKLATHPVLGFNIVKENNFPLAVQLGVLEHHERENGTGYPRKLSGSKISLYAKIISIACTFEAITAPRYYKEAKSSYDAMLEILRNEDKRYDDTVVKALLYSLSLYPIGAYVYLANGKIAQVTDVNPNDPRNPIVQIIGETDSSGAPKTVQTDMQKNKVIRVLNKQEVSDILKEVVR